MKPHYLLQLSCSHDPAACSAIKHCDFPRQTLWCLRPHSGQNLNQYSAYENQAC